MDAAAAANRLYAHQRGPARPVTMLPDALDVCHNVRVGCVHSVCLQICESASPGPNYAPLTEDDACEREGDARAARAEAASRARAARLGRAARWRPSVLAEQIRVWRPVLLEKSRRSLDVREEKGHGSGRKLARAHGAIMSPSSRAAPCRGSWPRKRSRKSRGRAATGCLPSGGDPRGR